MKVLGVTLARGGSKGVPRKHVRWLGGKPLLCYTLEAAKASKLDNYLVSSEDPAILKLAQRNNVQTVTRPEELAQDDTPTLPALLHAVEKAEVWWGKFDYVVEIRATSPLKTAQDIDNCIDLLVKSGADSVVGVTELEDHHPARAKWLDNGYLRDFIPEPENGRRQDLSPRAYVRNGTVYAFRRNYLMHGGKLFGGPKSLAYVMPPERSVNIDSMMDWKLCEVLVGL